MATTELIVTPEHVDTSGTEPDTDWTDLARCKGRTDLFFAPAGEQPAQRAQREELARFLCDRCAVVEPCREWAREHRESGFWGGESEEDRALAGHAPRATVRRSVARAARSARSGAAGDEYAPAS